MMLFKQLQGPQGLDATGVLSGVGELAGGSRVLVYGDGGIGRVGCYGCGSRMIMRL